ncbi:MAG: hypothetical protein IPH93_15225 [Saprospiraceae bacterium]|nr:hypothetical protein [Saprospiraceae bacterium]
MKSNLNTKNYLSDQKNYLSYVRLIFCNIITPEKGNDLKALDWSELTKNDTLKQYTGIHALKLDTSWPLGLLPEEYGWLQFEMELFDYLTEEVKEHIKLINKLRNCLKHSFPLISAKLDENGTLELEKLNKGGKSKESDKALSHKIYFDDENRPLIKTADEIKQVVLYLYNNLDIEKETEFKIFIELWRSLLFTISNTKSSLGDTASLRNFLLKMKPIAYNNKLSEIYRNVYPDSKLTNNFTVEDEYMLLYKPFDSFFSRKFRIMPSFDENNNESYIFYSDIINKKLTIPEYINRISVYKSPSYKKIANSNYYKSVLNTQEIEDLNINPFPEIFTFVKNELPDLNCKIFTVLLESKKRINQSFSELFIKIIKSPTSSKGQIKSNFEIIETLKKVFDNYTASIVKIEFRSFLETTLGYSDIEDLLQDHIQINDYSKFIIIKVDWLDDGYKLKDDNYNLSISNDVIILGVL